MGLDTDLALVIGLVVAGFSIPAIVSALSDGRAPRAAAIAAIVGGGLVVWAVQTKPGGYTLNQVPDTVVRVVARFIG